MLFNELGLSAELLRAVEQQGYEIATPVQSEAIPQILKGCDILAGAQTGTGKTAGFTLPVLQRMQETKTSSRRIRALILTPTRELAAQVHQSIQTYGRYLSFRSIEIYGGVSARPQISKLRKGVDIVVATPGRLLDHVRQGNINLSGVEFLVLDEADRMLDMGFIRDIKQDPQGAAARSARTCCSRRRSRRKSAISRTIFCTTDRDSGRGTQQDRGPC